MIYLDNAATTPIDETVLDAMHEVSLTCFGNANAHYQLGFETSQLIDQHMETIASICGVSVDECIVTSGASESNNTVIATIYDKYKEEQRHVITTMIEHASMVAPMAYLQANGFIVDLVALDEHGHVDLNHLRELLTFDPVLVSVIAVDSETGSIQPLREIAALVRKYSNAYFHSDITQAFGKIACPIDCLDYASLSAHKLFGPVGAGLLIKKKGVPLVPLIKGGRSTTIYRSSTPSAPLIVGLSMAMQGITKYQSVSHQVAGFFKELYDYFTLLPGISVNSRPDGSPFILNCSWVSQDIHKVQQLLSERGVYISLKSACSMEDTPSSSVLAITGDTQRALTSFRISFSYKTTRADIEGFKSIFDMCYTALEEKR